MKRTEHTQKWLDALRSGEYEQCTNTLHFVGKYCCLGVGLMVLHGKPSKIELLETEMGLEQEEMRELVRMNDYQRKTFPEIADAIEAMIDE